MPDLILCASFGGRTYCTIERNRSTFTTDVSGEDICQTGLLRSSLIHSLGYSSPSPLFLFLTGFYQEHESTHTADVINIESCNADWGRLASACDFTIEWKDVLQPFSLSLVSVAFRDRAFISLAYI